MSSSQLSGLPLPLRFWFDHVPLSCVPPRTSQSLNGLIATLMNWSVLEYFRLMWSILVGTRDRSRAQFVRLAAPSPPRSFELQCAEMSAKSPVVRMRPPSEPSKIWVGLAGLTAMTCWSGWIPPGAHRHVKPGFTKLASCVSAPSEHQSAGLFCASNVRSVNVRFTPGPGAEASGSPAVVEYSTARPFERPLLQPTPFVLHGSSL